MSYKYNECLWIWTYLRESEQFPCSNSSRDYQSRLNLIELQTCSLLSLQHLLTRQSHWLLSCNIEKVLLPSTFLLLNFSPSLVANHILVILLSIIVKPFISYEFLSFAKRSFSTRINQGKMGQWCFSLWWRDEQKAEVERSESAEKMFKWHSSIKVSRALSCLYRANSEWSWWIEINKSWSIRCAGGNVMICGYARAWIDSRKYQSSVSVIASTKTTGSSHKFRVHKIDFLLPPLKLSCLSSPSLIH